MSENLGHREWMALATEEYHRIDNLLSTLTDAQWHAPTDCTDWAVRDIVAHLAGTAEAAASVPEQLRQQRLARAHAFDGTPLDAVNALQVRERTELSPAELRRGLANAAAQALRARGRLPAPIRALRLPFPPPLGWASLGFLNDTVYTRDAWMHRIDISRAVGAAPLLTAEHDGRIIADAAHAWQRAAKAGALTLTGPAECSLPALNPDAEARTLDAVDFARALSGRGDIAGIRSDLVLF